VDAVKNSKFGSKGGNVGTAETCEVRCFYCGKVGHIKRQCFKFQNKIASIMESGMERNEEKEAEDSYNKSNLVYLTAMETDVCAIDSVPIVHIKGVKQ
jgi:DNA-directed RNA polymerase subunit N (RpoN/RPB10)